MAKNKSRKPYVGVDLGGTSMRAGVVAPDGTVLGFAKRKTKPELGAPAGMDRLAETIQQAVEAAGLRARHVGGGGVGRAGPVGIGRGAVRVARNRASGWP